MKKVVLKGITWDHSRGYIPMVATAQRFSEMNAEVEILWQKRSLQEFADQPISKLSKHFDLLVIDHPWVGSAAAGDTLLPLDEYLNEEIINDLKGYSVGRSYESYHYNDHQWALPIDAATPVASYRPDLLKRKGLFLPKTYKELLELAEQEGVLVPAIPIDSLMNFYMFCSSLGEHPFLSKKEMVSKETGIQALKLLKSLLDKLDRRCFEWNPVKVYEMMTQTNDFVYCPFAYGYSNYARKGYALKRLSFHDLVALEGNKKLISTLGGTGIAASAHTKEVASVISYLKYITSAECQQTLYFEAGGQPAHFLAWDNYYANFQCAGFFKDTLPALKRSFLRPRYNGYLCFQDQAGEMVRNYLMEDGSEEKILQTLNELYYNSLR